jgi:hypothetical protein
MVITAMYIMAKNAMAEMIVTNMCPVFCAAVKFLRPAIKPITILGNQQTEKKKINKQSELKMSAPSCEIHPLPCDGLNNNSAKHSNAAAIAAKNVYRTICMMYNKSYH